MSGLNAINRDNLDFLLQQNSIWTQCDICNKNIYYKEKFYLIDGFFLCDKCAKEYENNLFDG